MIHAGSGIDKKELDKYKNLGYEFPKSKIIACVDLVDCLELDENLNKQIIAEDNIAYGSKIRTGYAWKLENVKKIDTICDVKGQLGLWNMDISEINDGGYMKNIVSLQNYLFIIILVLKIQKRKLTNHLTKLHRWSTTQ